MALGIIFIFISLFCFLFSNPCYSETDTLHQGQELKDWDVLTSSNRVFCLKFFNFGTMVSPYLGVFYRNNEIRPSYLDVLRFPFIGYPYIGSIGNNVPNNPVWVANRNNPIPDIYGKLIIDVNGKLSIISSGGTVLDLFNPTPLVTRNASVTLLDTGNLVLRELHPDGSVKRVLWQSFDYPTDTLLPGMKLGINLKTGHRWSLTSWRNDELPAEGLFTLVGDLNRTGQMAILRQGNVHWVSGPWQNGEFRNTHLRSSGPEVRFDYVSSETEQSFTYLTRTYDSYPALRMHQDGQLMGSPLNLKIKCRFINQPPGCAEDEFEKLECRKDYSQSPRRKIYYNYSFEDEYVYGESYNIYDCQRICWSNCSCVAYAITRNRIGCQTYGKKVYTPGRDNRKDYYTFDYHGG
ncbi:putative non-specific serine/threonine protein kinase [Helianthus annuus]|nr:putative non-specific serine/threonine protein kinase [Helianthus annuus]